MVWVAILAIAAGVDGNLLLSISTAFLFIQRAAARRRAVSALVALAIVAAAFFLGRDARRREEDRIEASKRLLAGIEGRKRPLTGWVADFPQEKFGREYFQLRIRSGLSVVRFRASCPYTALDYGDSVRITRYRLASSMRTGTRASGAWKRVDLDEIEIERRIQARRIAKPGGWKGSVPVRFLFWPIHRSMREALQRRMGRHAQVPLALTLGEKRGLPRSLTNDLRRLGISHLFALSGMHLGLVGIIVFCIFSLLAPLRSFLILVVLGIYVGTAGNLASLQRAFAMVVAASAGRFVQRAVCPETLVGDAVFALLVVDPMDLYSVGLQMSFAATFAVMRSLRRTRRKRCGSASRRVRKLLLTLRTGLYAQAFIAPVSLYYFGGVSLFSAPATVVFLPVVFAIMSATFAGCMLELLLPHVSEMWFDALSDLVRFFGFSLHAIASQVPPPLHFRTPNLLLCYSGLLILTGGNMKPARAIAGMTALAASFVVGSPVFPF